MGDATGPDDRHPDVVDELILDQVLAVPDRIENFADRERRRAVLADQTKRFLILRRRHVFQPEETIGLERSGELRALVRRQAVMYVVQEVRLEAERVAQT